MKEIVRIIPKLYDLKFLIGSILLFLIIRISNIQLIPDYLNFSLLESHETFLFTLWTVIIGSASFILTILLVVYNSVTKEIKRNSLEHIIDNPWIKIIFSLFSGVFIFVSLTLLTIKKLNITTLYFSSILTIIFLLIQFPLIVLSLKYSNSLKRIKKILKKINEEDVNNLVSPPKEKDLFIFIENIEKNRLILLKDIGIFAIKNNDWSLPQTIINELFEKLITPLDNKTSNDKIIKNLYCFNFICNHFKNSAIQESDYITVKTLLNALFRTHKHLAIKKIRNLRDNPIDEGLKDFYRLVIEKKDFYNIQQYILRDANMIIRNHLDSIEYDDETLPTSDYIREAIKENGDLMKNSKELRFFWYYVKRELSDILFDTISFAIKIKNKNVYNHFNWQINSLLSNIYDSKYLTDSQKEEAFDEYFYRARNVCNLAIENGIYDNVDIISNMQIEQWLSDNRKNAFRCLYYYSDLIIKLNKHKELSTFYIDEYFLIARGISTQKIDKKIKNDAVRIIIETGFKILTRKKSSKIIKNEIIRQLKWLKGYFNEKNDLMRFEQDFGKKIDKLKI